MSQNRDDLPWFPVYASNMISDKRYRKMEPIEIALWIAILMECWSNSSVPADPIALAKWLGWSVEDVKAGLTERVQSFFNEVEGELVSPQLEEHYKKQMKRRTGLSEGGKKGAKHRWKKNSGEDEIASPLTSSIASPLTNPSISDPSIAKPLTRQLTSRMASFNTIKSNSFKSNSIPSPRKEKVNDDFVAAMDAYEVANKETDPVNEWRA